MVTSSRGVTLLDLVAVRRVCSRVDRRRWKGLLGDDPGLVDLEDEVEVSRAVKGLDGPEDGNAICFSQETH